MKFIAKLWRNHQQAVIAFIVLVFAAVVLIPTMFSQDRFVTADLGPPWVGQATIHRFFLPQPPAEEDLQSLPKTARDVYVARVRISWGPGSNAGRDNGGRPPEPRQKIWMATEIKIIEVLHGHTRIGATEVVRFADGPHDGRYVYSFPRSPAQKSRIYTVVSHVDDDNVRKLLGLPMGQSEYDAWERES